MSKSRVVGLIVDRGEEQLSMPCTTSEQVRAGSVRLTMGRLGKLLALSGSFVVFGVWPVPLFAMTSFSEGDEPVGGEMAPLGAAKVANSPGRLGCWEHGMMPVTHYEFRSKDTAAFNEALKAFAAIQVPMSLWRPSLAGEGGSFECDEAHRLTLVLHDGPEYLPEFMLRGETVKEKRQLDWRFSVSTPINWHLRFNQPTRSPLGDWRYFHKPPPPPQIDAYIGGGGRIIWKDVQVPANIRVIDQRAEAAPVQPVGGGLVRGTVYSMLTGQPISGAAIILVRIAETDKQAESATPQEAGRAKTDSRGFAELSAIPAGRYSIVVRADKCAARTPGEYTNKGNSYHEFAVELLNESSVKGCVTDTEGHPLPGIPVAANDTLAVDGMPYTSPDAQPVMTDEKGCFVIRSLPWQGFTAIHCNVPGLHQTPSIVELYRIPSEELKFVMTGTGTVRGKVTEHDGKAPAGEVHVHIQKPGRNLVGTWGGSMKCQADGRFEFQGVPPGEYLVSADALLPMEGKAADAKSVTVKAGETAEVEITKAASGKSAQ